MIYKTEAIKGLKETTANLFKRVNLIISLNIALFTIFKAFSIYGLSFLFVSSQGRIGLSNIKIHRVVYGTFRVRKQIIF